jgi:hypothetical protein
MPRWEVKGLAMKLCVDTLVLTEDEREAARNAIREKAYFKWQAAGCPENEALKFWREGEVEWIEYCYVPDRYYWRAG